LHRTSSTNRTKREALRDEHFRVAEVEARMIAAYAGWIPIDWGWECIADAFLDFEVPAAIKWLDFAGEKVFAGAIYGGVSWDLRMKRYFRKEDEKVILERWEV
jgi:hypothetical protein